MKIAVITLHHVRNIGSLLQTLATVRVLEDMGHTVEVIDYIPKGLTLLEGVRTIRKTGNIIKDLCRTCGAFLTFSDRQIITGQFLAGNVPLTKNTYRRYAELAAAPPDADLYLCGSDQIWNTQNSNEKDDIKAYYLCFVPAGKKKVSYSSSIGKTDFQEDEAKFVAEALRDFHAVSVRERHAVELLGSIGISPVTHVLDPTMLVTPEQWDRLLKIKLKKPGGGYIFVYNLNRNPKIKSFAQQLAKEKQLQIVNFTDALDFIKGAKNRMHNTPQDFLYYIKNAEYVLTDSFHGTVFSILFNKRFLTFSVQRFNSRIESLLEMFGLTQRYADHAANWQDALDSEIDYDRVNRVLDEQRKVSHNFLEAFLK